jgi:hypothetical protein
MEKRLREELIFTSYKQEVPIFWIQFEHLAKKWFLDHEVVFNRQKTNWNNCFMQLLYAHSMCLAGQRCPEPFYLQRKPSDRVICFDRSRLCTIKVENRLDYYVPVYFQTDFVTYAVILSLDNLMEWNWLHETWDPRFSQSLVLNKKLISLGQMAERIRRDYGHMDTTTYVRDPTLTSDFLHLQVLSPAGRVLIDDRLSSHFQETLHTVTRFQHQRQLLGMKRDSLLDKLFGSSRVTMEQKEKEPKVRLFLDHEVHGVDQEWPLSLFEVPSMESFVLSGNILRGSKEKVGE